MTAKSNLSVISESLFCSENNSKNCHYDTKTKQESIPVGCVPPVCKQYMIQWPPPDVTRGGPQVSKFELVWGGGAGQ